MDSTINIFRIRPFETKTLSWWYQEREQIDMSPPYQRQGNIWKNSSKAFLIDSILNGFDLPKFYIADFTYFDSELNKKNKPYAVIDGRQRFESIFDFIEGRVPLSPSFILYSDPSLKLGGKYYDEVKNYTPKVGSAFDNFNISVMSVITNDQARINELFVRLNSNKPLSGAEIRNAMKGKVPELLRKASEHRFFLEKISFPTIRGQDKNTAAKLLMLEFLGSIADTKKVHLDEFVLAGIQSESSDVDSAYARVTRNLDFMCKIFDDRDKLLRTAGQIPVFYWIAREFRRNSPSKIRQVIREFFEEMKDASTTDLVNADLGMYRDLNRSVNDQFSIFGRFQILAARMQDSVS